MYCYKVKVHVYSDCGHRLIQLNVPYSLLYAPLLH